MREYVLPFYVNAVDALPSPVRGANNNDSDHDGSTATKVTNSSSCLHIDQLFACDADDAHEAWSHVLLANYMIDLEWLLRAAPSLARVREKLVVLSGERGSATMHVHYDAPASPSSWQPVHMPRSPPPPQQHGQQQQQHQQQPHGDTTSSEDDETQHSVAAEYVAAARRHGLQPHQLVVLEPPLPYAYGTHHTKMALCVNERGLRVAVFTGNFVYDDWTHKTQGIYVQDFPRKRTGATTTTAREAVTHDKDKQPPQPQQQLSSSSSMTSAYAPLFLRQATPPPSSSSQRATDYEQQLRRYLAYCGVAPVRTHSEATVHNSNNSSSNDGSLPLGLFSTDFLSDYDFSAARVWLVCSVPGMHTSSNNSDKSNNRSSNSSRSRGDEGVVCNRNGFGLQRLAALTRMLRGPSARADAPAVWLSWQYSSQGALHDRFLRAVQLAMLGGDADTDNDNDKDSSSSNTLRNSSNMRRRGAYAQGAVVAGAMVQVVYPTEDEVRQCLEGWRGGLSLPVRARSAHAFVNARLYRWGTRTAAVAAADSTRATCNDAPDDDDGDDDVWRRLRQYALPHIKSYACMDAMRRVAHWFVLTSANLSQAAWGSPSSSPSSSSSRRPRGVAAGAAAATASQSLFVRSYELGVLYDATSAICIDDNNNDDDDGCYTVTPSCRLPLPCAANSTAQLYAVPLATATADTNEVDHDDKDDAAAAAVHPVLYVPYNLLAPTPYMSTLQQQQQEDGSSNRKRSRGNDAAVAAAPLWDCTDVPWAVDMPHRGLDCLQRSADVALTQHTHYGPSSWRAPVRTNFDECTRRGGTTATARATAVTRARDTVECIEID